MANRQEVGGASLGGVRQYIKRTAVRANRIIGNNNKRLGRNAVGECRQVRVALDLAVQGSNVRVSGKRHLTICCRFEFR